MFQEIKEQSESEEPNDQAALPDDDSYAVSDKKPLSKWNVIGFFVIIATLGVLCVVHMRAGPKSAMASAPPPAETTRTISQFLAGGANDIRTMKSSLETTEKQVESFQNYPSVHQVPLGNLKTDPFAFKGDDMSGDATQKRAELQAAMEKAVADLKLQSIMYSGQNRGRSACMINNGLCSVGQQVAGFTIEQIKPNSVLIRQGDFRFELKIEK